MHYRWMKEDPAYPALFAEAKAKAIQSWEDEAITRANEGVFEPFQYQGQFVFPIKGYEKDPETGLPDKHKPIFGKVPYGVMKKSDRLLEFLLRGGKPDVYRDRGQVEVTGAGGGPIEIVERLTAARQRLAKKPKPTDDDGGKEE